MESDYEIKSAPRLLYLPNELEDREQFGPRSVFENMLSSGELSAYQAYSFLIEQKQRGSTEGALDGLLKISEQFQPDIILWQHPGNFPIPLGFGTRLKNIASHPVLVYDERDVYGGNRKPFTPSMRTLSIEADILFLVGLGRYADLFRHAGATRIFYSPHCIDTLRFGHPWDPLTKRQFDVVMIGNIFRPTRMKPGLPGWKNRLQLAERLSELMGDRFALYGRGWDGLSSARGKLEFLKQEEALRESWLSVGWDYYDQTPFYFSNRLPIALMSGVAHVTNYQPGYEIMFQNGKELCYAHSVEEMIEMVHYLLSLPRSRLIEVGLNGQKFAKDNLATENVFRNIIRISATYCRRSLAKNTPLSDDTISS
jgi:hypothetical protein